MSNENDINRFECAQKNNYEIAKRELKRGKKVSHWMWFMFPQLRGLGSSAMSYYYGLNGEKEALDYYRNKKLKRRLIALLKILLSYDENTKIEDVLGEVDSMKLHSSMTLFFIATGEDIFLEVLKKFFNRCLDTKTVVLLNKIEGKL